MKPLHAENAKDVAGITLGMRSDSERKVIGEDAFRRMIAVERKRTERSSEPFLLMMIAVDDPHIASKRHKALETVMSALVLTTRETDVVGWYKEQTSVGVLFTGLGRDDKSSVLNTILNRVSASLRKELTFEQFRQITISFHFFPDDWDKDDSDDLGDSNNPALYPDMYLQQRRRRTVSIVKRLVDIVGSIVCLALLAPLFPIIAAAIKMTSKGSVFFKQQRVGQYGSRFTFLKFRSMYVDNDQSEHKDYVRKLIAGSAERISLDDNGTLGVFKLANDRRVTQIGRILRQTSLDEIPQFLNVLVGDMSLVGPRPPIPYELAAYEIWHRRRLLQVKPGITGLWQVTGRSRVTFDEMVRLDLQYAKSWSLWLDLKIMLRTPAAVIKGAY